MTPLKDGLLGELKSLVSRQMILTRIGRWRNNTAVLVSDPRNKFLFWRSTSLKVTSSGEKFISLLLPLCMYQHLLPEIPSVHKEKIARTGSNYWKHQVCGHQSNFSNFHWKLCMHWHLQPKTSSIKKDSAGNTLADTGISLPWSHWIFSACDPLEWE